MSGREDLYIILEVARVASLGDIKRAFRKLARRHHPDINPGDRTAEDRFKRISEAYEILSDPLKREFYDQNGFYAEGVLEPQGGRTSLGFKFQGFDFSGSAQSSLGEMFGQFFSRKTQRTPARGQDVEHQISISFRDSIRGMKTRVSVRRRHSCAACQGTGGIAGKHEIACPDCAGTGSVSRMKGRLQFAITCSECGGAGRIVQPCSECGGEGRVTRNDIIEVEIPAGVGVGSHVRFAAEGDAGPYGGPAGDLNVITNVSPHSFFSRAGHNIQCTLPITIAEAALGSKIEVPTVDGPAVVRIPPGTQNGQVFRLRGRGAPSLVHPGMRGDQLTEVRVTVPRVADERSKEILKELARLNPEDPRKDLGRL